MDAYRAKLDMGVHVLYADEPMIGDNEGIGRGADTARDFLKSGTGIVPYRYTAAHVCQPQKHGR